MFKYAIVILLGCILLTMLGGGELGNLVGRDRCSRYGSPTTRQVSRIHPRRYNDSVLELEPLVRTR